MRLLLACRVLVACDSLGTVKPQHVRCYSAGTVIYDGDSEGVVYVHEGTWTLRDSRTHEVMEVMGDCVTSPIGGVR